MKSNFLNIIVLSLMHKKKFTKINKTRNSISILKILIKFNLIKFVKLFKKSIIIFFNYKNNRSIFKIKQIKKSSKKNTVTVNLLKKNFYKNKQISILSTSNGILTINNCINTRIGGIPIFNLMLN